MQIFDFPGQTGFYRGKVRDVYSIGNDWLLMIASDRISAFDVVLPRPIPYKGQVLNQLAAHMLRATASLCPNWLMHTPTANSSLGRRCEPYKVEMVIRGNLTGHAWRTYRDGGRLLCGVHLPEGLHEHDYLPEPIITPTTKAAAGHDEDISREEIIRQGIVPEAEYRVMEDYTRRLFEKGREMAAARGLILADTKYEFGKLNGEVCLMDEIHTPDSSRYFIAAGFDERQARGEKQQQLSKEFVREWLIANGFMGKEGQSVPEMTDEWISTISGRYIELYEKVTGEKFVPVSYTEEDLYAEICKGLKEAGVMG